MELDFKGGHPLAPPRTPDVIPVGKFEGVRISLIETSDLRALQKLFFRRFPAIQEAIADELVRRRRKRGARRASTQGKGKAVQSTGGIG